MSNREFISSLILKTNFYLHEWSFKFFKNFSYSKFLFFFLFLDFTYVICPMLLSNTSILAYCTHCTQYIFMFTCVLKSFKSHFWKNYKLLECNLKICYNLNKNNVIVIFLGEIYKLKCPSDGELSLHPRNGDTCHSP